MSNFVRKFTVAAMILALVVGFGPALMHSPQFNAAQAANTSGDVQTMMKDRLELAAKVAKGVRTFGSSNGLELVPCLARDRGFSVIAAGAYLDGDPTNDTAQIDALRANALKGCVTIAVLGTNPTANGRSVSQITQEITAFKKSLLDKGVTNVQVTTAERFEVYRDNPALVQAVDVVMVSLEPFFEGPSTGVNAPLTPDQSFTRTRAAYDWLTKQYPDKPVVISETGWPTAGPDSRSTEANAAAYLHDLLRWSGEDNVPIFVYSLVDEPDLAKFDPNLAHFGLYDQSLKLKSGLADVFPSTCVPVGSSRVTVNALSTVESMTCFAGVNFVAPNVSVTAVPVKPKLMGEVNCNLSDADLLAALRKKAIGITNVDLSKVPIDLSNAGGKDSDGDGIPDAIEVAIGTNPLSPDTDHDGYSDRAEIEYGYSPLKGNGARLSYDLNFAKTLRGKAFLQVQSKGEGWYVSPVDAQRSYALYSPEARSWACKQ